MNGEFCQAYGGHKSKVQVAELAKAGKKQKVSGCCGL